MMYRSYHASSPSDEEQPRSRRRTRRGRTRRAEAGDGEAVEKTKKPEKTALVAAVDILARQEYSEAKLFE